MLFCSILALMTFRWRGIMFIVLFCFILVEISEIQLVCDRRTDRTTDRRTDGRTDGRTDRRTDTPSYRDARTHLKREKEDLNREKEKEKKREISSSRGPASSPRGLAESPRGLAEGGDGWTVGQMYVRTDGRTKSPCSIGHRPLRGRCPKSQNMAKQ